MVGAARLLSCFPCLESFDSIVTVGHCFCRFSELGICLSNCIVHWTIDYAYICWYVSDGMTCDANCPKTCSKNKKQGKELISVFKKLRHKSAADRSSSKPHIFRKNNWLKCKAFFSESFAIRDGFRTASFLPLRRKGKFGLCLHQSKFWSENEAKVFKNNEKKKNFQRASSNKNAEKTIHSVNPRKANLVCRDEKLRRTFVLLVNLEAVRHHALRKLLFW